jgi:Na+/H+-dicarboxylate symporter
MLSAVLVGLLGLLILPDGLREILLTSVVEPIYNTFFNILGCIAGPMIFLSVAWGIYGIGDVATLGRIGKRMILRYIAIVALAAAASTVFFPLLGPGLSAGSDNKGQFSSVAELLLGVFPSSIVEPFMTGNTLQIIFMAVVIGIALLYLGKQTSSVARAIEQVNLMVQFMMEIISRLVPYVIFLVVVNLIWSDSADILISSWKLIVLLVAAMVIAAAIFLVSTGLKNKVSAVKLLKKSMPTFLVALTTASSAASFSSNVTTCEKNFGIDESLVSFGIPLGMVVHKPMGAIYDQLILFFFAAKYGVSCSVGWLVIAVIISTVIAIATPPIPGGGAVGYTVLFAQMGIPMEALAIALTIDIITDFIITAFEMLALPLSLVNISADLGMIDEKILKN